MHISRILKGVSGGLEAFFGIPLLGGAIILMLGWTPLTFMLVLHIIGLVFSIIEKQRKVGNILGIITSCLAWIPILGMILHIITGLVLIIDAARTPKQV